MKGVRKESFMKFEITLIPFGKKYLKQLKLPKNKMSYKSLMVAHTNENNQNVEEYYKI